MDELRARIEKLEKQNRWMKRLGIAAFLCVAVTIFIAADAPLKDIQCRSITTSELVLVDPDGKLQANFKTKENGPRLTFNDSKGTLRTTLSVDETGPKLSFYDSKGETRATLNTIDDGPGLFFYESKGTLRAIFATREKVPIPGPVLSFMDKNAKPMVGISTKNGHGVLQVFNTKNGCGSSLSPDFWSISDGKEAVSTRIIVSAGPGRPAGFQAFDASGKRVYSSNPEY